MTNAPEPHPDAPRFQGDPPPAPAATPSSEPTPPGEPPVAAAAAPAPEPGSQPAAEPAPPRRRLTRSRRDSVIGGVAGGFAEYVGADPTLVRLVFAALAFVTGGTFVLVYLGAWIVMPEGDAEQEAVVATRDGGSGIGHGLFWGAVLILLGALLLLRQLDIDLPPWDAFLAGALIAVGLLLLIESRRGLHGGLTVLAVILTVLLGLSTLMNVTVHGAFGEQTVRPQEIADLDSSYGHAFGSLTLDLDELEFPEGITELTASILFGNLTIDLPDDVGVRAEATSMFGRTQIGSEDQAGFSPDWEYQSPNYADAARRIHLDVSTLFGSAQVNGGR